MSKKESGSQQALPNLLRNSNNDSHPSQKRESSKGKDSAEKVAQAESARTVEDLKNTNQKSS